MAVTEAMVDYIKKNMCMIVTNGEVRKKLKHADLKIHSAFPKTTFTERISQEDMTLLIRDAILSPTYKIK